jgi:hypothetical protein
MGQMAAIFLRYANASRSTSSASPYGEGKQSSEARRRHAPTPCHEVRHCDVAPDHLNVGVSVSRAVPRSKALDSFHAVHRPLIRSGSAGNSQSSTHLHRRSCSVAWTATSRPKEHRRQD